SGPWREALAGYEGPLRSALAPRPHVRTVRRTGVGSARQPPSRVQRQELELRHEVDERGLDLEREDLRVEVAVQVVVAEDVKDVTAVGQIRAPTNCLMVRDRAMRHAAR